MTNMLYPGKRLFLLAALACACSPVTSYALTVTATDDANSLVNTILGSGVTLVGSPTYTGADQAQSSGTFSGGLASGIGIESGILLTNGVAEGAVGPNNTDDFSGDFGAPGSDLLLDPLVSPGITSDATLLGFSFTTTGGNLSFNYVFGSEEYPLFAPNTNTFNDVLGVFLDGTNIALLPGTTEVVSVNNIANSVFYIDNPPGTPDIQYDGFSAVLATNVLGLSAGTHTITFAIADVDSGFSDFDSGVFIQAGSFSVSPTGVPEPSTLLLLGSALGAAAIFKRRQI